MIISEYWIMFLSGLLLSIILTPAIREWAIKHGWVDMPGPRKIHQEPMPTIGGAAIYFSFLLVALAGVWRIPESEIGNSGPLWGLFISSGIVFILGLVDDKIGLNAPWKFSVLTIASIILWVSGGRIEVLTNPFGDQFKLGILSLPFTILWLVGVSNALNLTDGLDGLAGGIAYIASFTLMLIAIIQGEPVIAVLMAAASGSTLGFLRYNLPPAKIFMGDNGALTFGFILASTAVISRYKATVALTLLIPIVALGIPIADTLFSILRRAWAGKPLFQADRGHLHHKLLDLGLTPWQIIGLIYGVCILLSLISFSFIFMPKQYAFMILAGISLLSLFALIWLQKHHSS